MKKIIIILFSLVIAGCITVKVPKYLHQDFPYRQDYAASFERTFSATVGALRESGWSIIETTDPASFEPGANNSGRQVLIFTRIRQTPLLLISSYSSLNAYLREMDKDRTQVEIRYLHVLPLPFKHFSNYQNDALVKKIFNKISEKLK